MIGTVTFYSAAVTSLTDHDVKLSDRLFISTNKLRGFERGKVGPVDSGDHIGGNYTSSLNIITTLPNVLPALENIDFSIFYDAANVWGVDYNKIISDSNVFRSSIGVAIDWFTPIGPLSISFTNALSKADSDVTESFRFNLGTTF
jgi:outer membrane protein insertion porin family